MTNKQKAVVDTKQLSEAFGNELDLMLFFVTWLKNNLNATAAYKELHPKVTDGSAEVLGSRMLGKVKPEILMPVYGLGVDLYMKQLRDGVKAMKRDQFSGEMYEDHTTRKPYHDKLGKLLGIENDKATIQVLNQGEMTLEFIDKNESSTT